MNYSEACIEPKSESVWKSFSENEFYYTIFQIMCNPDNRWHQAVQAIGKVFPKLTLISTNLYEFESMETVTFHLFEEIVPFINRGIGFLATSIPTTQLSIFLLTKFVSISDAYNIKTYI